MCEVTGNNFILHKALPTHFHKQLHSGKTGHKWQPRGEGRVEDKTVIPPWQLLSVVGDSHSFM